MNSLRMFDAAARHLNLSAAADELHLTKGAVSQQIKLLEASMGATLFVRSAKGLLLTPTGEAYFQQLHGALRLIEQATLAARAPQRVALTISCTPGFAAQWLVPRLARFELRCPDADIRIKASNQVSDFARDNIDVAVRHGRGNYPGLVVHKLFDDDLVVVAAYSAIAGPAPLATAGDWRRQVLLHDEQRDDWRLWLEQASLPPELANGGPVLTDSNALIEAVRAGRGLGLVPLALVQADLAANKLALCRSTVFKGQLAYYLVYPAWALERPQALQLHRWLLEEAAPQRDAARLGPQP